MTEPDCDVAIVGYGPVGALAGLLLSEADDGDVAVHGALHVALRRCHAPSRAARSAGSAALASRSRRVPWSIVAWA